MTYTIKELAGKHGLTLRALRFYEQRGLLKPTRNGRDRVYSENDALRIGEIVRGASFGFTLEEIGALLDETPTGPHLTITPEKAKQQVAFLRDRIRRDTAAALHLERIAGQC